MTAPARPAMIAAMILPPRSRSGALLILATILVGSMVWLGLELTLNEAARLAECAPPHILKLVIALIAALVANAGDDHGLGRDLGADVLLARHTSERWKRPLYFTMISFTHARLRGRDLPMEWRLSGRHDGG